MSPDPIFVLLTTPPEFRISFFLFLLRDPFVNADRNGFLLLSVYGAFCPAVIAHYWLPIEQDSLNVEIYQSECCSCFKKKKNNNKKKNQQPKPPFAVLVCVCVCVSRVLFIAELYTSLWVFILMFFLNDAVNDN